MAITGEICLAMLLLRSNNDDGNAAVDRMAPTQIRGKNLDGLDGFDETRNECKTFRPFFSCHVTQKTASKSSIQEFGGNIQ